MFDSSFRYGDSSFRRSADYQFDSSAGLLCRFVVSSCRFVVSLCRFVVSTRPLRGAIIRRTLHEEFTWFHALIHDEFIRNFLCADWKRDSLQSYLRHSIEFVLNLVNERIHEVKMKPDVQLHTLKEFCIFRVHLRYSRTFATTMVLHTDFF